MIVPARDWLLIKPNEVQPTHGLNLYDFMDGYLHEPVKATVKAVYKDTFPDAERPAAKAVTLLDIFCFTMNSLLPSEKPRVKVGDEVLFNYIYNVEDVSHPREFIDGWLLVPHHDLYGRYEGKVFVPFTEYVVVDIIVEEVGGIGVMRNLKDVSKCKIVMDTEDPHSVGKVATIQLNALFPVVNNHYSETGKTLFLVERKDILGYGN